MKITKISKFTALLTTMCVVTAQAQLNLKLDRDLTGGNNEPMIPVMALNGNLQYDSSSNEILIQSEYPVICNRVGDDYSPISNLRVRYTDPNGDNKGDSQVSDMIMGVQSNVSYDLRFKDIGITSENRSKALCVSFEGLDVIFDDRFGDEDTPFVSDVNYVLNNEPPGGYQPGSIVSYDVVYENLTGINQVVDLIEYFPYTNASDAYFIPGGNVNCNVLDENDLVSSVCFSAAGVVKDINLQPNYKIKLSMDRQLSASSQQGEDLVMMAAVFAKVATLDGGGESTQSLGGATSQSFTGFDRQLLRIPMQKAN